MNRYKTPFSISCPPLLTDPSSKEFDNNPWNIQPENVSIFLENKSS
jgi:hypothetical protein